MPNKFIVLKPMLKVLKFFVLRNWNFLFYFFVFGLFLSGCKKQDFATPANIPDSEILGIVNSDTSTVISFSVTDDSIRSDETSLNLLGVYNDPVFGIANASIYSQVRLSSENDSLGDISDLIVDSAILSLAYNGIYGNTVPQSFKVFELDEAMNKDSNYYSTKTFIVKSAEIGSVSNVLPNISDSAIVGGQKEPPQLRISLSNLVGTQLLNGAISNKTNDLFINYFKGILIKPDFSSVPPSGDGAILYFNLLSSYSKLTVYYRNTVKSDTLKFDFLINDNCARLTNFSFDRSGTSILSGDTFNGNNLIYVQSMSGVKSKIKFPFLENFVEKGRVAVNKAEIIFNVEDNSTNTFSPHSGLFLTDIDSAGRANFLKDQFEPDDHFGGSYNTSTKQYVFNITRHIQFLLTNYYEGKNFNYGLYLMAGGKAVNANRTILKGNKNTNGGVKLKISYTPL